MQKLTASDPGTFFNFGNTLTLHSRKAIIAADVATVDGHTSEGKVYIFLNEGGTWSEFDTLTASDGTTDDFFGAALALGPGTVLVSTPHPVIDGNSFQGPPTSSSPRPTANKLCVQFRLSRSAVGRIRPVANWVRTDMGGATATRSIAEGESGIVCLAADAPQRETGKFWRDRKVIPW